jgi:hypothetical protein
MTTVEIKVTLAGAEVGVKTSSTLPIAAMRPEEVLAGAITRILPSLNPGMDPGTQLRRLHDALTSAGLGAPADGVAQ